MRKRA